MSGTMYLHNKNLCTTLAGIQEYQHSYVSYKTTEIPDDESAFIFQAKLLSRHMRVSEEVEQSVCESTV